MPELQVHVKDGSAYTRILESRPFSMGRSLENDLNFPNDPVLSRRHLVIEPEGASWWVRDLGSKNGTLYNGARLEDRHILAPGDRVEAGSVTITYLDGADVSTGIEFPEDDTTNGYLEHTRVQMSLHEAIGSGFTASAVTATSETTPRAHRWQALIEAGRELAAHGSLNDLFPRILDLALGAVSAERGILVTEEPCGLVTRANRGEGFRLSSTVRERVLTNRESVLIVDVRDDQALRESRTIVESSVRSLMAVPLQTDEKVIGLLYVDSSSVLRPFTGDDLALITVLANIAAIRIEHARLIELEAQEKVLQNELRQAYEIQRGLLPEHAPAFDLVDMAGLSIPCRMVAGDYFDYRQMSSGRWLVLIGDVSGKGLSAALLAAGLQSRVHVLVEDCSGPECLLTRLNRGVCGVWPPNRFVTLFGLVLDPETAEFSYSNGGHNPPLLIRASGAVERLEEGGLPIGLIKLAPYMSATNRLDSGDVLLLYTDGIVEAESASGEEFGEERLVQAVRAVSSGTALSILDAVREAVTAHAGAVASHDDFTVVALRRR